MNRYLTKSRFNIARQCPTKLYYMGKPDKYPDTSIDNDFLKALAEGGFQVGALARLYYPGGVLVEELDFHEALKKTNELLQNDHVIIYEAAFLYQNLSIRADIVIRNGNHIELIEVKSKSFADGAEEFVGKKGYLLSEWEPYVYDVAFQKFVMTNALPDHHISASLMLVNKSQVATVDGLNQKFLLRQKNGRTIVEVKGESDPASLGNPLLIRKNIDDIIERIYAGTDQPDAAPGSFQEQIFSWAEHYQHDKKIYHPIGARCAGCEFQADDVQRAQGLQAGFHECWSEQAGFKDDDFKKPAVLKIWKWRGKEDAIVNGQYLQEQLTRIDLDPLNRARPVDQIGWTSIDRQEIQINKSRANDPSHELDKDLMTNFIRSWTFPLHFIDFETTAVAIPFNKGRRPYEQVAFQFSHHTVDQDGTVTHRGQWINAVPGYFPNFDFVRALKMELENDEGTIFRYAAHENTVLNVIVRQLNDSAEADKEELIKWIKTISHSSENSVQQWQGSRDMVDLLEVVIKCYYHPASNGSNSLKHILPAVVGCSEFLQKKYSNTNYGQTIKSLNFKQHQWLIKDEAGNVINPYKTLPQIHEGIDNELIDEWFVDEEAGIADGGAAMTAYARMQFTEMSDIERQRVIQALLRYCELDTLAMVMLYEAWKDWCK